MPDPLSRGHAANSMAGAASQIRTRDDIRAVIAHAAKATGVDFNYLLAQARIESGLNPSAKAKTSSASGLYQFISDTWLETLDKHASTHGLAWADNAISTIDGKTIVADTSMRARLMALRFDPAISALMAGELARDNAQGLQGTLGRMPDSAELYLAHFLGKAGAIRFLGAMQEDASQPAAALFPKPAAANASLFYQGGKPRTLGEFMAVIRDKVAQAMDRNDSGESSPAPGMWAAPPFWNNRQGGWASPGTAPDSSFTAQTHTAPAAMAPAAMAPAAMAPAAMADVLRSSFGPDHALPVRAQANIRSAYARLKAFQL
ncbi:MAG: transglycosylase SLT domain-containing protein [Sphingomonadaceae bacterium]